MEKSTIAKTVAAGLCCSCGVCSGVCPAECISYRRHQGMYIPIIDNSRCTRCGLCADVCPGLGHNYEPAETAAATVTGPVLTCCNAWSKDVQLRHVGASGGVVSTMIRTLLTKGLYDGAFCLDSYDYREQLKTRLYTTEEVSTKWSASKAPKSRYLPVSHEDALSYMKAQRDARLILVGSSCALRGLEAAVRKLHLDRSNYLFIGLFCDKVFNYNVLSYFENSYAAGASLKALHFKNKESGGWPGDMKFFPEDGEPFYVPLNERARAKAYFMPERCLYCVDKLNASADLSLGDNYTGQDASELGSNSVIIRTQSGMDAWNAAAEALEHRDIRLEEIQTAQYLTGRLNNLYFGDLRTAELGGAPDLNRGVPREMNAADFARAWNTALRRLRTGALYDSKPEKLQKQLCRDNRKPNPLLQFARRCYRYIKRRLK